MLFRKINHFAFRCIMLGEHRPVLADLLWARAQNFMQYFNKAATEESQGMQVSGKLTEDQIAEIHNYLKEIKTPEDILVRSKSILKRHTDQN